MHLLIGSMVDGERCRLGGGIFVPDAESSAMFSLVKPVFLVRRVKCAKGSLLVGEDPKRKRGMSYKCL